MTSPLHQPQISQTPHISPWGWLTYLQFRCAGVVVVYIGYISRQSLNILYLIATAYIISMGIESLIGRLELRCGRRRIGILLGYILLVMMMLSGILVLIPFLMGQLGQVIELVTQTLYTLQTTLQTTGLPAMIVSYHLPHRIETSLLSYLSDPHIVTQVQEVLTSNLSQIVKTSTMYLSSAGSRAITVISRFFSTLFQIVVVLIMAILFSLEKDKVIWLRSQLLPHHTQRISTKMTKLYSRLGAWLQGQILLCLIIGVSVYLGLWIVTWVGIPLDHQSSLAIIAGLTEFVPYMGPLLWALPALLVGGLSGWLRWLMSVGILYAVIQRLENNVFIPIVMNHALWVSPLLIFVCMLVGAITLGILGVILAIPLAVIITILLEKD